MAFEDLLVTLRDDQLSKLRCQKPLQSTDPPQFIDLFSDAGFKAAVQLRHLVCALPQFAKEPRILHCNGGLRGEVLQQRDLLVGEWADLLAIDRNKTEKPVSLTECYSDI